MSFTVAIVGRPNVGKSTLFNRLVGRDEAIVEPTAGVTRDRKYGIAQWGNKSFIVIDTGGLREDAEDRFEQDINTQVALAMEEASLVLLVVDGKEGLTDEDKDIARRLRKLKKPVLLVCNKVDTSDKEAWIHEFHGLGIGKDIYAVSASNGYGTGELMDALAAYVPEDSSEEESALPRIAVVGRPNVGKSSLLNALTGSDRSIVSEMSGTTRDSIDTEFHAFNQQLILVDTAGIRKRRQIDNDIEFFSTLRSIKAIRQSDVCLLLIDATEGITRQDLAIFWEIAEANKGVVVLVNKWDLVEKDHKSAGIYEEEIRNKLAPYTDVPIYFTSTVLKQRLLKALEHAVKIAANRNRKISTSRLNEVMLPIIKKFPPPVIKSKEVNIKFVTQLPTRSPAIAFFCNHPQYVKEPYQRFLENKLRENFDFCGIPVRLYFRQK